MLDLIGKLADVVDGGQTKGEREYKIVPFPRSRQLVVDVGWMARRKSTIRGLFEVDVSRPRRIIRNHQQRNGEKLSFTAYLVACAGQAIEANKSLHAYRDWRGRLVVFEEVDIATMIEIEHEGTRLPLGHIVRAANRKSVHDIHSEIREVQRRPFMHKESSQLASANRLPRAIRRLMLRLLELSPRLIKRYKGTVVLSSVGMFGSGGGWGLSLPSHTLGITVGGISEESGFVNGQMEAREMLHLTLDFDHDLVDGAPAARFAQRYRDLIESGQLLS